MDASVRNKCEAELLALVRHIAGELCLDVIIESTAFSEGGLKEVWKFLLKPQNANALVAAGVPIAMVLVLIQIAISLLALPPSSDKEQEVLTKDLTKLSIEEKKLQIQKLRRELEQGPPSAETVDRVIDDFNGDYKVVTRRSNFYKGLVTYPKVSAVGFGRIAPGASTPEREQVTTRSDFAKFIFDNGKLAELVNKNAEIEIVAPVITGGNFHWKGMYGGEVISFAMRDTSYKDAVSTRRESFQHGDVIVCSLHTERKLDPVG